MAIGNPFNGTLRGRLGESVFSRKAGAQHVRAYVQKPANPQSKRQLAQRVKFGTCAKFYQHGVQNLFKFAFEFKKPGQDDYNAFLQANVGNVPCNTRKAYNMGMPNLGKYIMSQGSLPSLEVLWSRKDPQLYLAGLSISTVTSEWENLTVGEISAAIIDRYNLQQGDFITIALVSSGAEPSQSLETAMERGGLTEVNPDYLTNWVVRQFTLDVNSKAWVSSLGVFQNLEANGKVLVFKDAVEFDDPSSQGVVAMVSRNTSRGVKVSTSRMVVNLATAKAIEVGMSDEWTQFCAENFAGSTSSDIPYDNILQGSISGNDITSPVKYMGVLPVTLVQSPNLSEGVLPVSIMDFDKTSLMRIAFQVRGKYIPFAYTENTGVFQWAVYRDDDLAVKIGVSLTDGKVYGISQNAGRNIDDIVRV